MKKRGLLSFVVSLGLLTVGLQTNRMDTSVESPIQNDALSGLLSRSVKRAGENITTGTWTNKDVRIDVSDSYLESLTYTLDGGAPISFTSPKTFTSEGSYVITARDKAGNESSFVFYIDKTAPKKNKKALDDRWVGVSDPTLREHYVGRYHQVLFEGKETADLSTDPDTRATKVYKKAFRDLGSVDQQWGHDKPSEYAYDYAFQGALQTKARSGVVSNAEEAKALIKSAWAHNNYGVEGMNNNLDEFSSNHTGRWYMFPKPDGKPWFYFHGYESQLAQRVNEYLTKEVNAITEKLNLDGRRLDFGEEDPKLYDDTLSVDGKIYPLANEFKLSKDDWDSYSYTLVKKGSTEESQSVYNLALKNIIDTSTLLDVPRESGAYTLTEYDRAGNSTSYDIAIDNTAPTLSIKKTDMNKVESTSNLELNDNAKYYAKKFQVVGMADYDRWASITADGKTYLPEDWKNGQTPLPEWSYERKEDVKTHSLSVQDRSGNKYAFTVEIIDQDPSITFNGKESTDSIPLTGESLSVVVNVPKGDKIQAIDIYMDNKRLTEDATGNVIGSGLTEYKLLKEGSYRVRITTVYGFTMERSSVFSRQDPVGTMSALNSEKRTRGNVSVTFDSTKYKAQLVRDGKVISTVTNGRGDVLVEGKYAFRIVDLADERNHTDYPFEIDRTIKVSLDSVVEGGVTNQDVVVSWKDEERIKEGEVVGRKDGKPIGNIRRNQAFSEEGVYQIDFTDDVGNKKTVSFTISKRVKFHFENLKGQRVDKAYHNEAVRIVPDAQGVTFTVKKDEQAFAYDDKKGLDAEGRYDISLEDQNKNFITTAIVIDKTAPKLLLGGATDGSTVPSDVTVSWEDTDVESSTVKLPDGSLASLASGQTFVADGAYEATVTDRAGNVATASFTIKRGIAVSVVDEQGNEFPDPSAVNKAFRISEGEQGLSVTARLDGQDIPYSKDALFSKEGSYEFAVKDSSGNSRTLAVSLDLTPPTISLEGTTEGGKTNADVKVSWTDANESQGVYSVDGGNTWVELGNGNPLTQGGSYLVKVTDKAGNESTATFKIKKGIDATVNDLDGNKIEGDAHTKGGFTVQGGEGEAVKISKDGQETAYDPSVKYEQEGSYHLEISDEHGNKKTVQITVDRTAPGLVLEGGENGKKTSSDVAITSKEQLSSLTVKRDGEVIDYALGDRLTAEGVYEVIALDSAGNETKVIFQIARSNSGMLIGLVSGGVLLVGLLLLLVLLFVRRHRKKDKERQKKQP